jgi:hypothetical protein
MLTTARASLKATRSISHHSSDDRLERMKDLSRNWPDPKERRTVPLKALPVPGGPGTMAAAQARQSSAQD